MHIDVAAGLSNSFEIRSRILPLVNWEDGLAALGTGRIWWLPLYIVDRLAREVSHND